MIFGDGLNTSACEGLARIGEQEAEGPLSYCQQVQRNHEQTGPKRWPWAGKRRDTGGEGLGRSECVRVLSAGLSIFWTHGAGARMKVQCSGSCSVKAEQVSFSAQV